MTKGYFEIEIGTSDKDPNMVRATLADGEDLIKVLGKYRLEALGHISVKKVLFTDPNSV